MGIREFLDRKGDMSQSQMRPQARQAAERSRRLRERVVTRIGCHLPRGLHSMFVCDVCLTWWRSRAFSAASAPVATDQRPDTQSSWLAAKSANEHPLQRKAVPIAQHFASRLSITAERHSVRSRPKSPCCLLPQQLQVPIEPAVRAPPGEASILPVIYHEILGHCTHCIAPVLRRVPGEFSYYHLHD